MVEIIKINSKNLDLESIKKAAKVIRKGGLIVYPTDTLYGLGADALDSKSVKKVIDVKGRDPDKPISIAFENLDQAKKYSKFNSLALKIAEKFLPGPLTLILYQKKKIPKELNPDNKIRVRIIGHPVVEALLKEAKVPITSTSANLSDGKSPVTAKEAIRQIGNKVDLVLDAGKCRYSKPSTVVDCSNKIEVVREGVIKKKDIEVLEAYS